MPWLGFTVDITTERNTTVDKHTYYKILSRHARWKWAYTMWQDGEFEVLEINPVTITLIHNVWR